MHALHHPTTRAALNLPGLCPVCGGAATRKVTYEPAAARETYRCPVDGESEYVHGRAVAIRVGGHLPDAVPALQPLHGGFVPLGLVAGA